MGKRQQYCNPWYLHCFLAGGYAHAWRYGILRHYGSNSNSPTCLDLNSYREYDGHIDPSAYLHFYSHRDGSSNSNLYRHSDGYLHCNSDGHFHCNSNGYSCSD